MLALSPMSPWVELEPHVEDGRAGMSLVGLEVRSGVAYVTLNRPQVKNAITPTMFVDLRTHIETLAQMTDTIGCVVMSGSGDCFSAGDDLRSLERGDTVPSPGFMGETVDSLEDLPQPVIAAVRGYCVAGGLELALACDFILASETAQFADTHARWGFSPGWGLSQRLPRQIGPPMARELMYSGRFVNGQEAVHIGLANRCVFDAELDGAAGALAQDIVANSWWSLREAKRLVRRSLDLSLSDGLEMEHSSTHFAPDARDRLREFTNSGRGTCGATEEY
jgi:enoyl-CoA hydratase